MDRQLCWAAVTSSTCSPRSGWPLNSVPLDVDLTAHSLTCLEYLVPLHSLVPAWLPSLAVLLPVISSRPCETPSPGSAPCKSLRFGSPTSRHRNRSLRPPPSALLATKQLIRSIRIRYRFAPAGCIPTVPYEYIPTYIGYSAFGRVSPSTYPSSVLGGAVDGQRYGLI